MNKRIWILLSVSIFFFVSSCDFVPFLKSYHWVQTIEGTLVWVNTGDELTYSWQGESWEGVANGFGLLVVSDAFGRVVSSTNHTAYYGSLDKKGIKKVQGGQYVGEDKNRNMSGFGVLVKPNEIYVGNFHNGKPDGTLVYYSNGYKTYSGQWKNGAFDGEGILFYEDSVSEGLWRNGENVLKVVDYSDEIGHYHGYIENGKPSRKGVLEYANGWVYSGEWNAGEWCGIGTFIKGQDTIKGTWLNGSLNGNATYSTPEFVYSGSYANGEPSGKGSVSYRIGNSYKGDWCNGKLNGRGELTIEGGDKYVGDFVNNKFEGSGRYSFAGGDWYEGDWKNGLQDGTGEYKSKKFHYKGQWEEGWINGNGLMKYANGDSYEGYFVENKRYGNGVYKYASGDKYEGEFVDGEINGLGVYYFSNGCVYEGEFEDGKIKGDGTLYCVIDGEKVAVTANWDGSGNIPKKVSMLFMNGDLYEGPISDGEFSKNDGVWYSVREGKLLSGLREANDYYKAHKETIDKVVLVTSVCLGVVAALTTGGSAAPEAVVLVGKVAEGINYGLDAAATVVSASSKLLDGDKKGAIKEGILYAGLASVPAVSRGVRAVLKSNPGRAILAKLSDSAKRIAESKVVKAGGRVVKNASKSVAKSAIRISKTAPFKQVVKVVSDGAGGVQKTFVEARTSVFEKIKGSKFNQKVAKRIAKKDRKMVEKYAKAHKLGKEKREKLLKEMSDDPEFAEFVRSNPEKNIKRWVDSRKPVNQNALQRMPDGSRPINYQYAGKSYYFSPHLNPSMKNELKKKGYIKIDGGKTSTILTEDAMLEVEFLGDGSYRILGKKGPGLNKLDKMYPNGVPYSKEGFPDFVKSGACKRDARGDLFVIEVPSGFSDRESDIRRATEMAKKKYGDDFDMTGYTWHHLVGPPEQLVLVDYTVHKLAKHRGGVSVKNAKIK